MNSEDMIKAVTDDVVYNEGNEIKTLDGSVQADIVINRDDKEYINEETEQTNKLLDDERELKREMYFRQSRILYPEKEEWVLSMAIDAFMEQEERNNKSSSMN
tara:strand:+ start:1442 stop:1750 length:309 start_codon:yes stop_codon:yes gene_type:complete